MLSRNRLLIVTISILAISSVVAPAVEGQQSDEAAVALQRAVRADLVDGDLDRAIVLYRSVVDEFGDIRPVAAEALLRIGMSYEKLGRREARAAYEELLRDYPDQREIAAQANNRLTAFAGPSAPTPVATEEESPTSGAILLVADLVGRPVSISPDAKKVARWDFAIGQNFSAVDIASGRKRVITDSNWVGPDKNADFYDTPVVWSADGTQIAITKGDVGGGEFAYELRAFDPDGQSRLVYRNEANLGMGVWAAGWLRDGSIVGVLQNGDKTYTIGIFGPEEQTFRAIHSLQWNFDPYQNRPDVSPDGRFVVFEAGEQAAADLHILSTDGQQLEVLTAHPADDKDPVWAPDGRHVVFLSRRLGSYGLWAVAVEDGRAAGEPFLIRAGMDDRTLLDWVTDGLAFEVPNVVQDAFTIAIDPTTGETRGEPEQVRHPKTGHNELARWSPDSERIAFVHDRDSIVVMTAAGGSVREFPLPTKKLFPRNFQWLPDGSGVTFLAPDDREQLTVFKIDVQSGETRGWPAPDAMAYPPMFTWTGHGNSIYYVGKSPDKTDKPDNELREYDLDTGTGRALLSATRANAGLYAGDAVWMIQHLATSPDFGSLAFHVNPGENSSTWVLQVSTGETRRVFSRTPDEPPSGRGPISWSQDGRHISWGSVSVNIADSDGEGVAQNVSGLGPDRFTFLGSEPRIRSRHWSAGRDRVLFIVQSSSPEVWLLRDVIPAADGAALTTPRR